MVLPILFFLSLLSCSKPPIAAPVLAEPTLPEMPSAEYGQYPLALLQSGENPLWFELGENGPTLIPSPEEAFLSPFIPWPLSLRIAGILAREDRIILGINREGFLVFVPWTGMENAGIALYRIDNSTYWKNYSVESLFFFNDTPAAMIYRNDYFIDTNIPPPSPRVWGLKPGVGIGELDIPAFADLPPEDGWDLEDLQEGPDERWYYRAIKKGGTVRGLGYFRTANLSLAGEPSSPGALQSAFQPRTLEQAPAPLRQILEASLGSGASPGIAGVVSPGFSSLRYYATPAAMKNIRENVLIYPGYYQGGDNEAIALLISPAGEGFIGATIGDNVMLREFALPPLPQGFVYTGAALITLTLPDETPSRAVLGTWEEQDGWNVGAAGFVLAGTDVLY
ncbi:hypothetical protein LQZ19_18590 [Treponema primitia]|uniref:hypothetical protein n=1 Tax=Treponema primitia TaxID=88058 RepID=UPI00397F0D0D